MYHKILRCPRKMTGFQHLLNCPETLRKCPGEGRICTKLSQKSEKRCTKRSRNLRQRVERACTKASRKSGKRCTKRSRNLRQRDGGACTKTGRKSENWCTKRSRNLRRRDGGETVHETKSESVERFAEGLLEGLRRAAAVR